LPVRRIAALIAAAANASLQGLLVEHLCHRSIIAALSMAAEDFEPKYIPFVPAKAGTSLTERVRWIPACAE